MHMKQISSTTARLLSHMDRIREMKKHRKIRPITVHLAPTDKCNLNCPFCSVRNRAMNELPIEEAIAIVNIYADLGAKSIEITGGGDPTLYYGLEELITHIQEKNLGIGLITNGLLINDVQSQVLDKLTWLRISLSGVDFDLEEKYLQINTDKLPDFTGCSYVYTTNTESRHIEAISRIANHLKAKYIRIVPNCYTPEQIEWGRVNIPPAIKEYPQMFMQIKDYSVPNRCHWKYIKPFVNSDGYVYQCSTCSLFNGMFPDPWRIAHWKDIAKSYETPLEPFDNSRCTLCFYSRQNEILNDLLIEVKHPRFL